MQKMDSTNCANIDFPESANLNRIVVFFYTPLRCQDLKKSIFVDIQDAEVAKTGSIPGLYVFNNIITSDEE